MNKKTLVIEYIEDNVPIVYLMTICSRVDLRFDKENQLYTKHVWLFGKRIDLL